MGLLDFLRPQPKAVPYLFGKTANSLPKNIEPFTMTVTTTPQPIFVRPGKSRIAWLGVSVRSLGACQYVAIGGAEQQERRLTVPFAYVEYGRDTPGYFTDAGKLYVSSDVNGGAVIEITGEYLY